MTAATDTLPLPAAPGNTPGATATRTTTSSSSSTTTTTTTTTTTATIATTKPAKLKASIIPPRRVYSGTHNLSNSRYVAGFDPSRPDHYPLSSTPEYSSMDSRINHHNHAHHPHFNSSSPPSPTTFLPRHHPATDRPKPKYNNSATSSSSTTVSSSHPSSSQGHGTGQGLGLGHGHRKVKRIFSDFFRGPSKDRHLSRHQRTHPEDADVEPSSSQNSSLPMFGYEDDDHCSQPASLPLGYFQPKNCDAVVGNAINEPTPFTPNVSSPLISNTNTISNNSPSDLDNASAGHGNAKAGSIHFVRDRPAKPDMFPQKPHHPNPSRLSEDKTRARPQRLHPSRFSADNATAHPYRGQPPSMSSPVIAAPPFRLPGSMDASSDRISTDSAPQTQRVSDDIPSVSNVSVHSSPAQQQRPLTPSGVGVGSTPRRRPGPRPRPPPLIIVPNSPGFSRSGHDDPIIGSLPGTPISKRPGHSRPEDQTGSATEGSDANDGESPSRKRGNPSSSNSKVGTAGEADNEPPAYNAEQIRSLINGDNRPGRSRDEIKNPGLFNVNNILKASADHPENGHDVKVPEVAGEKTIVGTGGGGWNNELIPQHDPDEATDVEFRLEGDFIIHENGLIEPPEHVTRKMSDGMAVEGIPTSSNKLIIVRSLSEFQESYVFKTSRQSNEKKANGVNQTLGRGAAGRVYLAVHKPSNRKIAVKEINFLDMNKRAQLRKELITLISHQSRFLVKSYGAFYDDKGRVHVTLEYMDRGSLADAIRRRGKIPENVVVKIAEHCLRGLHFLHSNHILHRDVKTGNILLSQKLCRAKLSDFGLARDLKEGQGQGNEANGERQDDDSESNSVTYTFVGTPAYMSPERLNGRKYTYASDIWALGISILECVLGQSPFDNMHHFFDFVAAAGSVPADMAKGRVSDDMYDFLRQMTDENENNRPRASDLLQHRWIQNSMNNPQTFKEWLRSLPALQSDKRERERERERARERERQINGHSNGGHGQHTSGDVNNGHSHNTNGHSSSNGNGHANGNASTTGRSSSSSRRSSRDNTNASHSDNNSHSNSNGKSRSGSKSKSKR